MARVCVGIPCYQGVSSETLEDYMRLMYHLGRRTEHECLLAIKSKSEQFRARNAIVEAALQLECDYLLFLDDDHVIDWEVTSGPNSRYGFVDTLINHLEADEKNGICGVVYYHRGAQCRPVLMKEGKDGGFYWMRDDEITGELQEVAVQGGGCMLIKMSIFDRIKAPWFEPEFDMGTDIQISKKAREAGFKVLCDTSIQIGHVLSRREVVTPNNRNRIAMENASQISQAPEGINKEWQIGSALNLYLQDAEEYLEMPIEKMASIAMRYEASDIEAAGDLRNYYATRGIEQLARQVVFHHCGGMREQFGIWLGMINTNVEARGLDFGCGSSPVGMELAMRGHHIDFVDIDGAGAYEFTKWRAEKRGVKYGLKVEGPYDYTLMLDSIEHIPNWQEVLTEVCGALRPGGAFITNYFLNKDFDNPEHVSMDHQAVKKFLVGLGVFPLNDILWTKSDMGHMDAKESAA